LKKLREAGEINLNMSISIGVNDSLMMDYSENEDIDITKGELKIARQEWNLAQKDVISNQNLVTSLQEEQILFREKMEILKEEIVTKTVNNCEKYRDESEALINLNLIKKTLVDQRNTACE
jgi:hypothetical protein